MNEDEVKNLAYDLMVEHRLWDKGWVFRLTNNKTRIASCAYRSKQIRFSRYFLDNKDEVIRDLLLHEIAHALVGAGCGHGRIFKAKCREIGCKNSGHCVDDDMIMSDSANPKYIATCPNHGEMGHFFRKPKRRFSCRKCGADIDIKQIR